ncbi:MAG: lipid-A-disaccharide synthase [Beijerinckiaceae bacterium]
MNIRVFLIAGEASGDQLGAGLMRAMREARPDVEFSGVGGPAMEAEGLASLFPLAELAVMGVLPVLANIRRLLARIETTAGAALAMRPDALVIIDSPDFTHRVAQRVRKARPDLPIIDYVSPTVWAWRPGRAGKMRAYIDHVLALLPFEPEAYRRLGGPPCTYVGHPLIEKLDMLRPSQADLRARDADPPMLIVLPGSRHSEISRLMPRFAETLVRLAADQQSFNCVLPAVSHLEGEIRAGLADWPIRPQILIGENAKYAAFRRARAALCASGTVTLELALAQVPMVVAYEVSWLEAQLRHFIQVPSIVLPNLILEENRVPEFLQENCRAGALAAALEPLFSAGPQRAAQMTGFASLERRMCLEDAETPSAKAARVICRIITTKNVK